MLKDSTSKKGKRFKRGADLPHHLNPSRQAQDRLSVEIALKPQFTHFKLSHFIQMLFLLALLCDVLTIFTL
jgi:hypothetical protein